MGTLFISTCCALLGVVSYGMERVNNNNSSTRNNNVLSSGNFTSFASYTILLGLGTTGFLNTLSTLRHGYDAAKRVFEVILSSSSSSSDNNTTKEIIIDPPQPTSIEI